MHLQISFAIHDPTKFLHYNADTKGKFVGTLGTICHDSGIGETLMLVRTAHISFGSMAVFPGGVCDPEDRVYCPLKDFENYGKLTAVRELYEETGILLLPPNIDHHQLASRRIPDGQITSQLLGQLWKQDWHLIVPILRLLTIHAPLPKRFDCMFYVVKPAVRRCNYRGYRQASASLQDLQTLSINKAESLGSHWLTPSRYLFQKYFRLAPPQVLILGVLAQVTKNNLCYTSVLTKQTVSIEPILLQFKNEACFLLHGDKEYGEQVILTSEPDSESKEDLVKFYGNHKPDCTLRRLQFLKGNQIALCFEAGGNSQQETIFRYLQMLKCEPKL